MNRGPGFSATKATSRTRLAPQARLMRSRNSRFMPSICRCHACASAATSRKVLSHRTGRVCAARVSPAIAGQAAASHASVASGRSNLRTTRPRKSPALSMGARILPQTRGPRLAGLHRRFKHAKIALRGGIIFQRFALYFIAAGRRERRRYRLRVRTEPSQGSNPGSIPGIATKLQKPANFPTKLGNQ